MPGMTTGDQAANRLTTWEEDYFPGADALNGNWQKITDKFDALDTVNSNIANTYATKTDLATANSEITNAKNSISALATKEQSDIDNVNAAKAEKLGTHGLTGKDYVGYATGVINPSDTEHSIEYNQIAAAVSAIGGISTIKCIEKKLIAVYTSSAMTDFLMYYVWAYLENGVMKKWMDANNSLVGQLDSSGSPITGKTSKWYSSNPSDINNWPN